MKVFSGTSNRPLAQKIASSLAQELSPLEIHVFPDGEKRIRVETSVVEEDCIVVQTTSMPVDQNYLELCFIVDALKRSGARLVLAVVPYMGYARQDHVFRSGEARSFAVVVKMLEAVGYDRVLTFDLHSIKIPKLFTIPVEHLSALPLFAEKIKEILENVHLGGVHSARLAGASAKRATPEVVLRRSQTRLGRLTFRPRRTSGVNLDSVLVSPDMGGIRRIKLLSEMLGNMPYVVVEKNRDLETGEISGKVIEGEIRETAFIVDDIISTGKTIAQAAELLKEKGAKHIYAFAAHAVFSEDASTILQNSIVEKVFMTNTINIPTDKQFSKLEILSIAPVIAQKISDLL